MKKTFYYCDACGQEAVSLEEVEIKHKNCMNGVARVVRTSDKEECSKCISEMFHKVLHNFGLCPVCYEEFLGIETGIIDKFLRAQKRPNPFHFERVEK